MEYNRIEIFDILLKEIGKFLVKEARQNMDRISFGRIYKIKGRNHIASRPYDSPNNLSGQLRKTIRYEKKNFNSMEFGAGNKKIVYATFLELGTQKMKPRPNYTRSVLNNENKIKDIIVKVFKNNFRLYSS